MRGILDPGIPRPPRIDPQRRSQWRARTTTILDLGAKGDRHDSGARHTLEDRAIVVQLQRKPKTASVIRLRKRDSESSRTSHVRLRAGRMTIFQA